MTGKKINRYEKIAEGKFFFDPDDNIYRDHFPSIPIVPGTIIINAFLQVLKKSGLETKNVEIKDFRFKKFLNPGEFSYQVKCRSNSHKCHIYNSQGEILVSGEICLWN